MQRITTTIQKMWLDQILAGTKKVEYRERKPYWDERLIGIQCPFELRLINGMKQNCPEATLRIDSITLSPSDYELHIGAILEAKNVPGYGDPYERARRIFNEYTTRRSH